MNGLLQNRAGATVAGFILSIVALQSWVGMNRPMAFALTPVELLVLASSIFLTAGFALRSTFFWDRLVFSLVNAALLLAAVTALFSLTSLTALVLLATKSLLWTGAAIACVSTLVNRLITRRADS